MLGFGVAAKTVFSVKRYKPREGEVDRFTQSPNLTYGASLDAFLEVRAGETPTPAREVRAGLALHALPPPALAALSADPRMHSPLDVEGWALQVLRLSASLH